ncbi:HAMP domain-containing protein [Myxococcota bacterium]|nr:HAMP domain-containing protein [Myxococcota bacterium]
MGAVEGALLFGGGLLIVGVAFLMERIARALRHGFSVRLQLFLSIAAVSLLTTSLIGIWAIERLYVHAAQVMPTEGSASELVLLLIRDLGPKAALLLILIGLVGGGAAFSMGRTIARPLEELTATAERIAEGARRASLPTPSGREMRQLTRALAAMRRALEERHQMEAFVADLSHELKNPVSAIRAAVEVLEEGAVEDPEARDRFIARIDEASQRLHLILQDLLVLARLEARGVSMGPAPLAFDQLIKGACEACRDQLEIRDVRLKLHIQPVKLRGEARWLRRAVDNLLSNAIRYSPPGGEVTLTLKQRGDAAVLLIEDQGPGVAPRLRGRIFERFVTDRGNRGGTGLGLAIVRSVAELHGGEIKLLEGEGGARFELSVVGAA